jgi:hypothetical protein
VREDPVEPALNAVKKDISNENVLVEKNPQSLVPFIGETTRGLTVPSSEGLCGQTPSNVSAT